jgi:hypothetical protein
VTRPDPTPAAPPADVVAPRPPRPPLVASTVGAIGAAFAMLVGGWLMLAPFALGYQPDGADWVDPTHADFWAGLGLLVVGVIVLLLSAVDLVGRLRAAGAIGGGARPEPAAAEPAGPPAPAQDDELTSLLKPLIAALSQDSERPAANGSGAHRNPVVDPANREMP